MRKENNKNIVFTISDNKAVKNEIEIGQTLGSYYEVLSGLQSGQKIISELNEKIKDGVKVKLQEN